MLDPIQPIALAIWEHKGRPEGQAEANWREAERLVIRWSMRRLVLAMLIAESSGTVFPAPSIGEMMRQPGETADKLAAAVLRECPECW